MDKVNLPPANQRIKELIDHFKNGNKSAFSKELGYDSAQKINRLFKIDPRINKYPIPSSTIISDISNRFDVVTDWILTGEGDMLKSNNKHQTNEFSKKESEMLKANNKLQTNEYGKGVPYFEDIESTGGVIPSMNEVGREIATFFIDYEHFNDCTAYIQHVGDSMYPKYCSGEIIAVKRIFNFNVVLWGEAYLVVTNDNSNNLRTVKLLFQHEDESKLILRSSNPNFKGDTIIGKEDIISLFIVKGKITRNQL